jgi:hypothetical protein
MIKKVTLLAVAATACAAFAAPGMASAAKLTQPAGTLISKGTTIVGTSTNTIMRSTLGETKCKKVTFNGIVKKNDGTTVEIEMDGANDKAETCEIIGLGAVGIDPTLTSILATASGPGAISWDFTETGICEASSTTSPDKVTWNGTSVVHVEVGFSGCGTGTLTADFSLATTKGVGIIAET